MGEYSLVVLIGVFDIESLSEAVTEVMGSTGLKSLTVVHKSLDSVSGNSTGELIAISLLALNNRHSKGLFAEFSIYIQHTLSLFDSLLSSSVDGVAFLPEELS